MKALVTGAGGFVGPYLCAHLRAQGDDVLAVDRRGERPLDVVDAVAVTRFMSETRPDVVYHLAAFAHVGDSWKRPAEVFRINVEGTANVLAAAGDAGIGRVLVVGSSEEYGRVDPDDLPLTEDAPLRPTTPYGASKVGASFVALQAWLGRGIGAVRVRPFGHIGPGQSDRYLIPALARRIAAAERDGLDEIRVGALDPVRDYTDVRDVVRAYRALALEGIPGEVYNVCSGAGVAVRDVAENLVARASRSLRLVPDPGLLRPVDTPRLVGDPSKLRALTGWTPDHPLDETLAAVLDEARSYVARQGP